MGLGDLVAFARDPLDLLERLARRGDLVRFRLGPRRAVFIQHPELIRQAAVVERRSLTRGYSAALLRTVLGNGLLVSEGAYWERQRRAVQPALRAGALDLSPAIDGALDRMLRTWRPGEIRDAHDEMRRLTLDIAARTILGIEPERSDGLLDAGLEVMVAGESFSLFTVVPGLSRLPTPGVRRARRGQHAIEAVVARGIANADGRSVAGKLRAHMDGPALRDELVTLLFTAFDTTAAALCWTLHLLATHPAVTERLATDATLFDRVILESLRLYPPVPVQARDVINPCRLDGTAIAPRTTIIWSQWVVHRDARWFDRPLAFDPDRWKGDLAERLHPFAYFPFGGGRRNCVGEDVGTTMIRGVLTALLARVRLEPVGEGTPRAYALVTLRPRGGMPMRLLAAQPFGARSAQLTSTENARHQTTTLLYADTSADAGMS